MAGLATSKLQPNGPQNWTPYGKRTWEQAMVHPWLHKGEFFNTPDRQKKKSRGASTCKLAKFCGDKQKQLPLKWVVEENGTEKGPNRVPSLLMADSSP